MHIVRSGSGRAEYDDSNRLVENKDPALPGTGPVIVVESFTPNRQRLIQANPSIARTNRCSYVQVNIRPPICLVAHQNRYSGHFRGGKRSSPRSGKSRR